MVKTLKKLDDSTSQIMFWTHVEHVENYAFCNKIYRFCIFDSLFVEVVKMYVDLRSKKKKSSKRFHAQLLLQHSSSSKFNFMKALRIQNGSCSLQIEIAIEEDLAPKAFHNYL